MTEPRPATNRLTPAQRLALFVLDGTLVDRQAAYDDAVVRLCQTNSFNASIE
ncbi:hypothetical protein [Streptomyces sp. NPDC098781]|uniref:hypothetical protein n=1 Tax=Streptomyces sp. NPDC098781 TaxID=3366097 RepID=UPI0037FC8710